MLVIGAVATLKEHGSPSRHFETSKRSEEDRSECFAATSHGSWFVRGMEGSGVRSADGVQGVLLTTNPGTQAGPGVLWLGLKSLFLPDRRKHGKPSTVRSSEV